MHIQIPQDEADKLARHAAAAGFDSVEKYVADFVLNLANHPTADELFGPLSDNELAASLAMIDQGMQQINDGEGLTVDEARRRTLENIGNG